MEVAGQFERIDGALGELREGLDAHASNTADAQLLAGQRTMEVRSPGRPYAFVSALHSR
jgi:hypothetical protein